MLRKHRRYWVHAGIFVMMMLCYVDRINLSVAAKPVAATYGLSSVALGYLFSSFLWTYLLCLVPVGMVVDRLGARAVTAGSLALWSVAGALSGVVTSYPALFATRLVLGVGEAASYPAGGRVVREWAPRPERGVAAALLNSGAYAGLALGAPVVGWIVTVAGWRASFVITGAVGLVFSVGWYGLYGAPEAVSWLSPEERGVILAARDGQTRAGGAGVEVLLRSPTMWGLALTQGCAGYTLYLFMTWLPTYLADSGGLDVMRSGASAAVPYAVAVPGALLLGRLSDRLVGGAGGAPGGRRRVIAACLLVSAVILLTPLMTDIWVILALFSISLTCVSTAMGTNIALTSDLLTDGSRVGMATGFLIMGGNIFGVVAPIATGYAVASPLGYAGAFVIAGALLLAGTVTVTVLTRRPIDAGAVPAPQPLAVAPDQELST